MNLRMVGKYLGHLILVEAVFILPACVVAVTYGEQGTLYALGGTAVLCVTLGLLLGIFCRKAKGTIYAREGFVVAGLGWVVLSILGGIPFMLTGEIPNFFHAFFESASGFTTTGASILTNVEALSRGSMFWRSFTHWLGGIGVLAFILALVRQKSGAGFTLHLLRAEAPGPQVGKVMPKMKQSMNMLFLIYISLSVLNLVFLLAGGMPVFDAFCTMFGTAGTGGFGIRADSMASYSPYLQTVTTVFMALFGVNFTIYILLVRRQFKAALLDNELIWYIIVMLGSIAAITASLVAGGFGGVSGSLHESAFTVSSIMTTTGYTTANFDAWPQVARTILLVVMVIGAMAGSTGGGFKVLRIVILFKSIRLGIARLLHPNSVKALRVNGKVVEDETLSRIWLYLACYCAICVVSFTIVSLDGHTLDTNLSAVLACFNNIGPGLGAVGPLGNYAVYSNGSVFTLTMAMLLGRLEIFPILLLFVPSTWRMKR